MIKKLAAALCGLVACAAFAAVDVNKATEAELDGIKGIGPSTSKQILAERKKSDFKNWEDLMHRVKGIGNAKATKLSAEGMTVAGMPYKAMTTAVKAKEESKAKGPAKDGKEGQESKK